MAKAFKQIAYLGGLSSISSEDRIPESKATEVNNIDLSFEGSIATRRGGSIVGDSNTEVGECSNLFSYNKNFGTIKRVIIKQIDNLVSSKLQWLNDTLDVWEDLYTGLETGYLMDFAPANGDEGNLVNKLVMCNGADTILQWNGAIAHIVSVTSNSIVCDNLTASTPDEGFTATGDLMVNGIEYAYTGISGETFTGVTPDPTVQNPIVGTGVIQAVDDTYAGSDTGGALLTTQGKLFLGKKTGDESTLFYSKTGDVLDFTVSTGGLGDAGFFTFMDGGGGITAIDNRGKNGIIVHKKDLVQQYVRTQNSDATVSERIDTLGDTDGCGATNIKAVTRIGTESYFISQNEGIQHISIIAQDDTLNLTSIMDQIKNTTVNYDWTNAAIEYFPLKRCLIISGKSSIDKLYNDKVVFVYIRNTESGYDYNFSIDDLNANAFIIDDKRVLYASSVDQNVYELFTTNSDYGRQTNHVWISKALTYSEPANEKEFNKLFINGFMEQYTKIKVSVIYGTNGIKGSKSDIISWQDSNVEEASLGSLGTVPLGELPLGGTEGVEKSIYIFDVPIHFDVKRSNRYKIKIETYYDDETSVESYWVVNNLSTNPTLLGIDQENVINSNL